MAVTLVGEPAVVVDPGERRVDVVYAARLADGEDPERRDPRVGGDRGVPLVPGRRAPRPAAETAQRAGRARPAPTDRRTST